MIRYMARVIKIYIQNVGECCDCHVGDHENYQYDFDLHDHGVAGQYYPPPPTPGTVIELHRYHPFTVLINKRNHQQNHDCIGKGLQPVWPVSGHALRLVAWAPARRLHKGPGAHFDRHSR